jgi:hypothetical protein
MARETLIARIECNKHHAIFRLPTTEHLSTGTGAFDSITLGGVVPSHYPNAIGSVTMMARVA